MFRGSSSHFCFDHFYIVDFHSVLTFLDRDLMLGRLDLFYFWKQVFLVYASVPVQTINILTHIMKPSWSWGCVFQGRYVNLSKPMPLLHIFLHQFWCMVEDLKTQLSRSYCANVRGIGEDPCLPMQFHVLCAVSGFVLFYACMCHKASWRGIFRVDNIAVSVFLICGWVFRTAIWGCCCRCHCLCLCLKYAILTWHCFVTKKFKTLDPHTPTV